MAEAEYVVVRSPVSARLDGASSGLRFGPAGIDLTGTGLEGVEIDAVALDDRQRADLRRDPATRAVAAAMPMRLIEPVAAEDAQPEAGPTWGVSAVKATESPFDGAGITVAVLDTGIDPAHPAFEGIELVRENFTAEADDDLHGHGTHCAGTIFGHDVGGQRIGVAPNVERALIGKVLGEEGGSSATIARAIQWAVNEGAHVVSMSLGIDFPGYVDFLVNERDMNVNPATSLALAEYRHNINLFNTLAEMVRAQGAFTQGTIIVAASGNESERPAYTIAVAPPAAGLGIVAIAALQQGGAGLEVAGFSNTEVDVSAPGVDVVSARAGGGLVAMSGTSMATPHAAGVAALWAQKMVSTNGSVNPEGLLAQLIARADTSALAQDSPVNDVGAGIVQAPLS